MRTILGEDIVLVLTDKGYVASYDDVNMLFWDQKDPENIIHELSKKFRSQSIHLLNQRVVPFEDVEFEIEQFLNKLPGVTVSYMLDHINPRRGSGQFRFKTDKPNSDWKRIPVSLSKLLLYKIMKQDNSELYPNQSYVGTVFSSTLNSKVFKENPFSLVEFVPGSLSDIPHNYRLELVYETFAQKVDHNYSRGRIATFYKFRRLDPTEYRRYECHVVQKKLKECSSNLNIVPAI